MIDGTPFTALGPVDGMGQGGIHRMKQDLPSKSPEGTPTAAPVANAEPSGDPDKGKTLFDVMPELKNDDSWNAHSFGSNKVVKSFTRSRAGTWREWPGKSHKGINYWVILDNGKAVGVNESPRHGFSYVMVTRHGIETEAVEQEHKLSVYTTRSPRIATGHCSCGWKTETTFVREVESEHANHVADAMKHQGTHIESESDCKSAIRTWQRAMKNADRRCDVCDDIDEFNGWYTGDVRYWGTWVVPDGEEDDGDYDWKVPTDDTSRKIDAIIKTIQAQYPALEIK
jgi:hypothetical protein